MICGRSKYGVVLLATLGLLVGEALPFSQPALAQTKQCSAEQIENKIKNLLTNPALVDALAACGSDAVPLLLRYLDRSSSSSEQKELENLGNLDYQRLLIISALGQMGSRASSSSRDLAKLIGRESMAKELDKVIIYTLWQIDGDPTRVLAQIAVDTREDLLARRFALYELQNFALNYANLIPGGVNSQRLEKTTNDALVTIALNPNDDLDFRFSAFEDLTRNGFRSDVRTQIQDSITSILLKAVQNQAAKPEERLDAAFKLYNMYTFTLKTTVQPVHAQIITPVLTQIIVETSNTAETRNSALSLLELFDRTLAERIVKEVSLPPGEYYAPITLPILRESTVVKLRAAPPAVCRYPVIQAVFAWKCR